MQLCKSLRFGCSVGNENGQSFFRGNSKFAFKRFVIPQCRKLCGFAMAAHMSSKAKVGELQIIHRLGDDFRDIVGCMPCPREEDRNGRNSSDFTALQELQSINNRRRGEFHEPNCHRCFARCRFDEIHDFKKRPISFLGRGSMAKQENTQGSFHIVPFQRTGSPRFGIFFTPLVKPCRQGDTFRFSFNPYNSI
jgi:hypothetical protein